MTIKQTVITTPREYRTAPAGGSFGPWQPLGGTSIVWDDYYRNESVSTPGFDTLKLNRYQLPLNPHTRDAYRYQSDRTCVGVDTRFANGQVAHDEYRGSTEIGGADAHIPIAYYPSLGPIENKALARLFGELSLTSGSAAVSLAEIGKTAEMIADTARRLAKAYSALRHGKLGAFSDALGITVPSRKAAAYRRRFRHQTERTSDLSKFAGNTWLEYSYGWKPLINDVYAQAQNLANYLVKRGGTVREARGSAKETKTTVEVISVSGYWKNPKNTVVTSRVSYVVRYKLADGVGSIANTFGLTNPALVAWELVPFSFVVDWFLPIGSFFEQLTATQGLIFAGGTKAVKHTSSSASTVVADKPRSGAQGETYTQKVVYGGSTSQTKKEKSRSVLTSFPYARLPEFKSPLSVSHALSGIALLQATFRGGVKGYVSR